MEFSGQMWFWRGPSPYHFVTIPDVECRHIKKVAPSITYGWGMVPCEILIGATHSRTSLWPKDGGYILPVKTAVREAEGLELGDEISVRLFLD